MISSDMTKEELEEHLRDEYELEKESLIERYRRRGGKRRGLKKFLIEGLLYTSDPVGSLEYIKNDSKLKLKEDEWEYARKIAFKYVKENMKEWGGATDDELNSDEMKEYFKSLGFADLVENKNENNGK